jgi:putative ABC transport system substrate-binding protein
MMRRHAALRALLLALAIVCVTAASPLRAETRTYRLALLAAGGPALDMMRDALPELRKLGYVEGRNLVVLHRNIMGDWSLLQKAVDETIASKPDAILVSGTPAVLALKRATRSIPIVFGLVTDPVGSGVVESLARPGGNVTGIGMSSTDLLVKRLELVKEAVPGLTRVAVMLNPFNAGSKVGLAALKDASRKIGVELVVIEAQALEQVDPALRARRRAHVLRSRPGRDGRARRRPGGPNPQGNQAGRNSRGAAGKAQVRRESRHRGAARSHAAAESPRARRRDHRVASQAVALELVANLKTAYSPSLTIPQTILVRAGEVIE